MKILLATYYNYWHNGYQPSASSKRRIPSLSSATLKALFKLPMWSAGLRESKLIRSGRWAWIRALNPKPFRQLVEKFSILTPRYLCTKRHNLAIHSQRFILRYKCYKMTRNLLGLLWREQRKIEINERCGTTQHDRCSHREIIQQSTIEIYLMRLATHYKFISIVDLLLAKFSLHIYIDKSFKVELFKGS